MLWSGWGLYASTRSLTCKILNWIGHKRDFESLLIYASLRYAAPSLVGFYIPYP